MKLPNIENAEIPKAKVVDYLLSASHRDGKHKAAFLARFGFYVEQWEVLRDALLKHAGDHEVSRTEDPRSGCDT